MLVFYLSLLETEEDRALFETYFLQMEENALKITRRILNSQSLAEDAAQNGWMNLIKNFDRFVNINLQERPAYIVTIMKNAALDVLRKEKRFVSLEEWDGPMEFAPISEETSYRALVEIIKQLPEPHRTLLERSSILNQTNREIARELEVSESTVSRRLDKARALLKERLEMEGFYL